ncbi:MAG: hypothetical protein WA709_18360 [Stellaceae bacterium]
MRGQLRQWKEKLAQLYRQFDRACCDDRTKSFVQDFVKRSSREGRRRALRKLARAFGPGVTLKGLRLDGNYSPGNCYSHVSGHRCSRNGGQR